MVEGNAFALKLDLSYTSLIQNFISGGAIGPRS